MKHTNSYACATAGLDPRYSPSVQVAGGVGRVRRNTLRALLPLVLGGVGRRSARGDSSAVGTDAREVIGRISRPRVV